jgi:hypothetical protein
VTDAIFVLILPQGSEHEWVWKKRGAVDSLPYYATLALGVGGIGFAVYQILVMAFPQKKA